MHDMMVAHMAIVPKHDLLFIKQILFGFICKGKAFFAGVKVFLLLLSIK